MLKRTLAFRRPQRSTVVRWTRGWHGALTAAVFTALLLLLRMPFPSAQPTMVRKINPTWDDWGTAHPTLWNSGLFLVVWSLLWFAVYCAGKPIELTQQHGRG